MLSIVVTASPIPMTHAEADAAICGIERGLAEAKQCAYDLWARGGWKVLRATSGRQYTSFYDCILDRFPGKSASQVYRLKDMRIVELNTGREKVADNHVRVLRGLSPDNQIRALDMADRLAETERRVRTTGHIEQAKQVIEAEQTVEASGNALVQQMVVAGEITALAGAAMVQALEKLPPNIQSGVMQVVGECGGLSDPALIPPLADMVQRENTPRPSLTLANLRKTGTLDGVPLKKATMTDLDNAKVASQSEYIANGEAERQARAFSAGKFVPQAVVVTIYRGDPKRSIRALRQAMGDEWFEGLAAAMMGE